MHIGISGKEFASVGIGVGRSKGGKEIRGIHDGRDIQRERSRAG